MCSMYCALLAPQCKAQFQLYLMLSGTLDPEKLA